MMNGSRRWPGVWAACALFLLLLSACAQNSVKAYTVPDGMESVPSGVVSRNERYELEWDGETACVMLRDRQSGHIWATTPYEYHAEGNVSYTLSSVLAIEYYDRADGSVQLARSLDCVDDGMVSARAEGPDLRVTFYFREAEITVTVTFTLREDSLQLRMNTDDFEESGKTQLVSVSLAPYLCAAANSSDPDSYLFVPSGSGALMYTDEDSSGVARDFSGEVYGYDPARTRLDHPGDDEPVRMPVFGVKTGENALFAIIENGDGAARIDATAGNPRNGHSAVYPTFCVRGFNNVEWDTRQLVSGYRLYKDVILLSKAWPESREFSVGYYPLTGADADYNGMAAHYREYLRDNGALQESAMPQQPYQLTMIGGAQVKKFTLGIPHNALLSLTTFDQAREMADTLVRDSGRTPAVLLKGVGKSGLTIGEIGGGFAFPGALGGDKRQGALEAFCESAGIPLFTDFDLVRFSRSGGGFNTFFNTARASDSQAAAYMPLKRSTRMEDSEQARVYYLRRSDLHKAANKLIQFSQGQISGIGLSTLGQTAYSDYREESTALKGGMAEQTRDILAKLSHAGHPVSLSAANAYAAGLADSIADAPLQNGGYDALDETIPFYPMVLRGAVPLYSTALNLSPDAERMLLRAVEAGVSPSFTLSYAVDETLAVSSDSLYYGILYDSNKSLVADTVKRTADFFSQTAGAGIRSHRIVEKGITQTVFDNGVIVLVNHTDKDVTIDGRSLPARSFQY